MRLPEEPSYQASALLGEPISHDTIDQTALRDAFAESQAVIGTMLMQMTYQRELPGHIVEQRIVADQPLPRLPLAHFTAVGRDRFRQSPDIIDALPGLPQVVRSMVTLRVFGLNENGIAHVLQTEPDVVTNTFGKLPASLTTSLEVLNPTFPKSQTTIEDSLEAASSRLPENCPASQLQPSGLVGLRRQAEFNDVDRETLLKPREVARLFGVTERTILNWAAADKLPSMRTIGGHLRYRQADVEELLEDRRSGARRRKT
jgi:excisionase family DNA binding protein